MNGDKLKYLAKGMVKNYFAHDVSKNAAALAYYLFFALFPLLIFLSNLLGLLQLDIYAVTQLLARLLPRDITALLTAYLQHISSNSSPVLLWFSLVFSVWFPYRAVRGLIKDVRTAYGLPRHNRRLKFYAGQIVYTLLLLVALAVSLSALVMGEKLLVSLLNILPVPVAQMAYPVLPLWKYFRYMVIAAVMYAAIWALYSLSVEKRQSASDILPGVAASVVVWLAVSVAFSFYVENFAGYSVIYGTLGAVMALLLWLYLSAIILIMGAQLNALMRETGKKEEK